MKKIIEELKGARGIEWFLVLLAISILLLMRGDNGNSGIMNQTQQEQRIASILSCIEGAGKVEVMISDDGGDRVLVVAEGAHDLNVCLHLQYAVRTILGTEISKIEIVPYHK